MIVNVGDPRPTTLRTKAESRGRGVRASWGYGLNLPAEEHESPEGEASMGRDGTESLTVGAGGASQDNFQTGPVFNRLAI